MHKLILSSTFLSAADAEKTGSDVFHDFEPLTLKPIEKYQQKYLFAKTTRWCTNFILTPEDCHMSWSAVEVNNRLYTLW